MTYNLRVMTAVTAAFYCALGGGGAFIGLFLASLGASYIQVSLVITLFISTTIIASALYGRHADRLGARRAWLAGGLLLLAVAYVLIARANTLGQAAGARIVEGIGAAIYSTISLSIVGDLLSSAPDRGRRMGIYRGIGSVAYAVGALIGGWLADRSGIPASLIFAGGSVAIGALLAAFLQPGPRPRPSFTSALEIVIDSAQPQSTATARASLPRLFLVGVVLIMAALSASSSMFPLYLNALGHSRTTIGGLGALTAVLEFPAMYFTGILSDAIGRAPLLAAGAGAIVFAQLLYIGAARAGFLVVFGQIMRSIGFASFTANAMSYTADLSGENDRAANSGLFTLMQNVGQLTGMLLGGTLAQLLGFGALFAFCAVAALFAALAFHTLSRRHPRKN